MTEKELLEAARKLFAKHVMSDRLTDEQILEALRPEPAPSIETALLNAVNKTRIRIEERTEPMALNGDPIVKSLKRKLGVS